MRGTDLSYEIPAGWQHFRDGNRLVAHGENNEELIISGARIEGRGADDELALIKKRLFQNAVAAVNDAASHPQLIITAPLERDATNRGLNCWTLRAQTGAGDTLFMESIVTTDHGVTLITFEAPNTAESEKIYTGFICSIRPNTEEA